MEVRRPVSAFACGQSFKQIQPNDGRDKSGPTKAVTGHPTPKRCLTRYSILC
jgi:hypothetical protein